MTARRQVLSALPLGLLTYQYCFPSPLAKIDFHNEGGSRTCKPPRNRSEAPRAIVQILQIIINLYHGREIFYLQGFKWRWPGRKAF